MKKSTGFFLILVLASGLACALTPTAPPLEASPVPVLRIGTSGDYPPFSDWPEAKSEPEGFEPDLLRAFAATDDHSIQWVRFRWADLEADLAADRFDIAAGGITVRSDRALIGLFGIPLAHSGAVALVEPARGLDLESLDHPGRVIAVNQGGHLERVTRSRFPRARVVPITPNSAVALQLERGIADAVVTDTREAPLWQADHPGWQALAPFTRDRKALLAAPGHHALLARIDAWLLSDEGSAVLDRLRKKHLGDDPATSHVGPLDALLAAVDERLALMPAVAAAKQLRGVPIEVPEREAHVLAAAWLAAERAATERGVAPPPREAVERFYQAQMDAAKEIQRNAFDAWENLSADTPDLDDALRPALFAMGHRMASFVVMLARPVPDHLDRKVADALSARGLDAATLHELSGSLAGLHRPIARPRRGTGTNPETGQ